MIKKNGESFGDIPIPTTIENIKNGEKTVELTIPDAFWWFCWFYDFKSRSI